ncbi:hypothetical protein [Xanthomonas cucurbitae]|uniref:Mu-like prophage FluMu N-terminal domain-containing protein n=1 Tax=Xanthomonas cucurbitae TaxID=56453 RepID=A0ABY7YFU3_9XANT|nr:hypothetical protein [Xanthomonas cucurbitae]WDM68894.1 hypothetical protein K6981_06405 [Xanthomonas cucurbitae]WDM72767.1 hypothetical protein K6978_06390 [Xanthomonas cucurbitae]
MAIDKVTVKSKSERGRWRAGLHFTRAGRSLSADDELSEEQLRAIAEDPELVVAPYLESDEERVVREAQAIAQAAEKAAADRVAADKRAAKKAEADRIAADKKAADKAAAVKKASASGAASGKSNKAAADESDKDKRGE